MNDLSSTLLAIFRSLLLQSPIIVTALVGCILVIIRWRALRRAALPAILGLGLFAGLSVFFPVVWVVVPRMVAHSWEMVFTVLGLINGILHALALGLIITAVVVGRSQSPVR